MRGCNQVLSLRLATRGFAGTMLMCSRSHRLLGAPLFPTSLGLQKKKFSTSSPSIEPTTNSSSSSSLLRVLAAGFMKPKSPKGLGEDAFVISPSKKYFGVADGVGGWIVEGVDAGIYARGLMQAFGQESLTQDCDDKTLVSLMQTAEKKMPRVRGSAPFISARYLEKKNTLELLNLGDCQGIIFSNGAEALTTEIQEHYLNCPFQLGDDPVNAGIMYSHVCKQGDILVLSSDGVGDNLSSEDLKYLLFPTSKGEGSLAPEQILAMSEEDLQYLLEQKAKDIVLLAQDVGRGRYRKVGSGSSHNRFGGGKLDDTTVILAAFVPIGRK